MDNKQSKYYKELKHGHKVGIGQDINQLIRDEVFSNGWSKLDNLLKIVSKRLLSYNFYIRETINKIEEEGTADDLELFNTTLAKKIKKAVQSFAVQEPTAKQIYYYIHLCQLAGEEHKQIYYNKDIHTEIDRLKRLTDEKNDSKENNNKEKMIEIKITQEDIDEHKKSLLEFENEVL